MEQSRNILKKFWGFDGFRPLQEEIVDTVIYGNDTLALLPTGGGKSVCFQVPGLAREGITLVVSPLIALMQDQVNQLKKRGIRAEAITSAMNYREIDIVLDNARFGGLEFLYTSPERLQTNLFIERFKRMNVGLIVVDEAHCISEWGHDFRPSYRLISELREIHPAVPMIALTATATERVKEDIVKQLGLKKPTIFEASFQRPNISYEIYPVVNKTASIIALLKRFEGATGIIYCQTRKSVKEMAMILSSQGAKVGIYHGGMDAKSRAEMLNAWLKDQLKVMVATNAFGMGIDKPDVRFVAHYEFPNNPEAYFQEAGRAGRDGLEARTFVFYEAVDLVHMQQQVEAQFPPMEVVKKTYQALCNHLQLAVGSGKGETFPVNLTLLKTHFNLDLIETYQSLKILEMNNTLQFTESVFSPTKVKFAVGNTALYSFQIKYEGMAHLITLLSRSYPGIFDQYFEIYEAEFCKRLKINAQELNRQLKFLEKNGIIDVTWKSDLPLVTFVEERMPEAYLTLNPQIYTFRKKIAEERWDKMHELLTLPVCRAQFLIGYFGQETHVCGKCDYCLAQKKENYTMKEIQQILLEIVSIPKSLLEIKEYMDTVKEDQIIRVLQWQLKEEVIVYKNDKYQLK